MYPNRYQVRKQKRPRRGAGGGDAAAGCYDAAAADEGVGVDRFDDAADAAHADIEADTAAAGDGRVA